MKIIIAPDSFKGSLSSPEVAAAMARGANKIFPHAEILQLPVADGGEGMVDALIAATGGVFYRSRVTGPLGEPVSASWGVLGDGETAVIEMSAASGLPLVPEHKRDPFRTTTRGTGELIKAALDEGCSKLIIGIGGSATNDGGSGMVQALSGKLLDPEGKEIGYGGEELHRLDHIDLASLDSRLENIEVLVACDVTNPLTGPRGASRVYGPQKGATEQMVEELDQALKHFARVVHRDLGVEVDEVPGAGAAGGLGAGLMAFLGGKLMPGIELVLDAVELETKITEGCQLVITGEGKLDGQSLYGKVPVGVAKKASFWGVPVVAIAGSVPGSAGELDALYQEGITASFSIINEPMSLQEAMENSREQLENTVAQVLQLWKGKN